jgi:anti-anti-sigma factor
LQEEGDTKNGEEKAMEIHTRKERHVTVVSVKGRIDAVTAPEFEKSLSDLISKGEKTFLLNLGDLEYISSAGLRAILATAKKLKDQKGKIVLTGLIGSVGEVFKISGFDSIFKIFDSEENALKEI